MFFVKYSSDVKAFCVRWLLQGKAKVALSTIHTTIVKRLSQTPKTAQTVHPAQCPIKQAQYTINISSFLANFLLFTGEQKCRVC
ncbi:hypothetical protein VP01_5889g1 [Puccinia sorghi]|uniref:Uncharacterized protein n=1 Tax=Puccinia sorghi TaxID=27349 RepID=A0A0L6UHV8_9BASI|nr:hypothetical protein VP01_5889g1 [Puccinia sorghi]